MWQMTQIYIYLYIQYVSMYMKPKETKIDRLRIKTSNNRYTYTYDHETRIITGSNKLAIGYGDTYETKLSNTVPWRKQKTWIKTSRG